VAIHGGSSENTIALAKEFFRCRLITTPFVPPSVPQGRGVLRLIVGAKLGEAGMQGALAALDRVVPRTRS